MSVTYGFVEGEEFEAFGHRTASQALMGGPDEKRNWWLCGDSLLVKKLVQGQVSDVLWQLWLDE